MHGGIMTVLPRTQAEFTTTHSYRLKAQDKQSEHFAFQSISSLPFDELILSWNGKRPAIGKWKFFVRLKKEERWSEPILYAEWTSASQRTFKYAPQGAWFESYQDAVYPREGYAHAFEIQVTAEDGASLLHLDTLHVCLSSLHHCGEIWEMPKFASVSLPQITGQSQMCLQHPRASDLCSPTATTTAINYLRRSGQKKIEPLDFAAKVHDDTFDIYGNWILNTAQAYVELEGLFECQTKRLAGFSALHSYLMRKLPVVVSVRGPLPGSSHPLTFGHLICVTGYDAEAKQVLCIDSGFPKDSQTTVRYYLHDFLEAWRRRYQIAYVFLPKSTSW